jgi:hypothetical protein
MDIRRAMPVVQTTDPDGSRDFYVGVLGFRIAMEQDGLLMLASTSVPTTQLIVVWDSPTAMDPAALGLTMSVEVEDVDAAHADVVARGLDWRSCGPSPTSRGACGASSCVRPAARWSTSPATSRAEPARAQLPRLTQVR